MSLHSSDSIRIGSKDDNSEPLSNLRKMLIFKGDAYSLASSEIPNILISKFEGL